MTDAEKQATEARIAERKVVRQALRELRYKLDIGLEAFSELTEYTDLETALTDSEQKLLARILGTVHDAKTGIWAAVDLNGIREVPRRL